MNDPTLVGSDTAAIHVLDSQWVTTYGFRADTALRHCTIFTVTDGAATLANLRPGCLSTGEQLLWQVAAWLNGYAELPDIITLRSTLDTTNWVAVRNLIADTATVDHLMSAICAAEVGETLR